MYFYYDIVLNFGSDGDCFSFYEWEEADHLDYIKKIPLFRVPSTYIEDHLNYQTKIEESLLLQIKEKTILKKNEPSICYALILSDGKNALALEFNEEGLVLSRSKLLLSDELNLCEAIYEMKETTFSYEKIKKYTKQKTLRQIQNIKNLIKCELDTLYENKNISKLKYLYYEWFNQNNDNLQEMYKEMTHSLQKDYDENVQKIYDLIKMSYHNVN